MGCDGGTIPKRDELVKLKKKPEQVSLVAKQYRFIIVLIVISIFHIYRKTKMLN